MKTRLPITVACAWLLAPGSPGLFAADFHVATVQELYTAIETAEDNGQNDTIYFEAGTYASDSTISYGGNDDLALTLRPEPGVKLGEVVVSATMNFSGDNETVTLIDMVMHTLGAYVNFTATNCHAKARWDVSRGRSSSITGCHFAGELRTHNLAAGGTLVVDSCHLEGMLYTYHQSSVTLRDTVFKNGVRPELGGILLVENCEVRNYFYTESESCTVRNNRFLNCKVTVLYGRSAGTLVEGNEIIGSGSWGIECYYLQNGIVRNNTVVSCAGGIFVDTNTGADDVKVLNNTVAGCTSSSGIHIDINSGGTVEVQNNIVWDGDGTYDIYLLGSGGTKKLYNNAFHAMAGLWDEAAGNIDVAPLFLDPTHENYRLQAGSACIDAGLAHTDLGTLDGDGNARVADAGVDIGAYEQATGDTHPADTDTDWVLSSAELTAYSDAWKNGTTWATGPARIPIEYVTRAGYLKENNGGNYQNSGGGKPLNWTTVAP